VEKGDIQWEKKLKFIYLEFKNSFNDSFNGFTLDVERRELYNKRQTYIREGAIYFRRSISCKYNMINSDLSLEVQLLFRMTDVKAFYGFPKSVELVRVSDHFKEKDLQDDVAVVLAKTVCYEQIIENMIISLDEQDKFWRKINGYSNTPKVKKHYERLELMNEFINFDKKDEMQKLCDDFRERRNSLAHDILEKRMEEWVNLYSDVDDRYEEIVCMYQEQDCIFLNRIIEKLSNPQLFLMKDKDYQRDINIIRKHLGSIRDEEEQENCIQMINLLNAFMANDECPELQMKFMMMLN